MQEQRSNRADPSQLEPTERFTVRVPYYVKYRPGYPPELLALMEEEMGLTPQSAIADIGSGTGLLAEMFLKHGNAVYGVEPNLEMRRAGEEAMAAYPRFRSVNGAAEATTLPDACADFITVGQAFHWFDVVPTRREFVRILRLGGSVVLVWNRITTDTSAFMMGYEAVWRLVNRS